MRFFSFFYLIFLFFTHPIQSEESMEKFKILQDFENFYNAMQPAQENTKEAFIWFSGIPDPIFNAVMHLSCNHNLIQKVDAIIENAPPGLPIAFWVHPENHAEGLAKTLTQKGFQPLIVCPLMAWSVTPIAMPSADIRKADADMTIFHDILATTFHLDQATKEGFVQLLGKIKAENYLLYLEDKPVGIGTLFPTEKVGGIFDIAVLPDYQKHKCGKAMMEFLMKRAHDLGLEKLILLSSPVAEKLYSDLGFEKCFDIEIYAR